MKTSNWFILRNNFFDDEKEVVHIDAWETDSGDEEGKTIAKIHYGTLDVEYIDLRAITDKYAQAIIRDTVGRMSDIKMDEQTQTNLTKLLNEFDDDRNFIGEDHSADNDFIGEDY